MEPDARAWLLVWGVEQVFFPFLRPPLDNQSLACTKQEQETSEAEHAAKASAPSRVRRKGQVFANLGLRDAFANLGLRDA